MNPTSYRETSHYRCLNEHFPHQSEEFYLVMCGIEDCTADKGVMERLRDGYHLHVILSGKGVVKVNGEEWTLGAGQLFMIKPRVLTAYYPLPEDPWTYCWLSFDGKIGECLNRLAGFGPGVYCQDCRLETTKFYRLCDQILNIPQLSAYAAIKRLGLALEFLGLAAESFALQRNARQEHKPLYHRSEYVEHAVEYMQNNYSSITVADVSNYLGIDRSYLAAIFKQSQGISPSEYLLQIRMRQSSHMLLNLSMPIQDIARYVGYDDSLTFSKAFKRFFGVSPKYYREMSLEARPDLDAVLAARREKPLQE